MSRVLMTREDYLLLLCDSQLWVIENDKKAPEYERGWAALYWSLYFIQFAIEQGELSIH